MSSRILPLVLLLASVLGGSYLRLVDLGAANFNADELDHYFAAASLKSGAGPVLPSGNEYSRGIEVTRLVSLSMGRGDDDELAARIPFALFGVLNLVLFAVIAWRMAGPWPAAVAVLLLAIYPEAIVQSRMTRFYTLQLNLGILAMFTGWMALKGAGAKTPVTRPEWGRACLWGGATICLLGLATRVQPTTLSVAIGWYCAVAVAGVADLMARGRRAWRHSFPLQATTIGILLAVITGIGFWDSVQYYGAFSQNVGAWSGPGSKLAYFYLLSADFPIIVALIPLIFIATTMRDVRLGVYLMLWFAVALLLHSLVFPWKGERYILLTMPALFLAVGVAASMAGATLHRWLAARIGALGHLPWTRNAGALAAAVVAAVGVFALVTQHGFNVARRVPPIPKAIDWEAAAALIDEWPGSDDMPLGSSIALPALHYWERADFVVGTDFLQDSRDGRPVTNPQGSPDWYGGVPTLTRPSAIRRHFPNAETAIVGIDTDRWRFNNIDPELRRTLSDQAEEICEGRCGDLLLFVWSLDKPEVQTRLP